MKDFEEGMRRLEEIHERLGKNDISLKTMLELYEEGMRLSQELSSELDSTERRVEILSRIPAKGQGSPGQELDDAAPEFTSFDTRED